MQNNNQAQHHHYGLAEHHPETYHPEELQW